MESFPRGEWAHTLGRVDHEDQAASAVATLDATRFRKAMGLFPTGVSIVTVGHGPSTFGVTVNAVTAISLEPMLVLISIARSGRIRPRIEAAGAFGLSVLTDRQLDLCLTFARSDRPEGVAAADMLGAVGPATGTVLVNDALMALECRLYDHMRGGDHELFLGEVLAIHHGESDATPLVFYRGQFTRIGLPL